MNFKPIQSTIPARNTKKQNMKKIQVSILASAFLTALFIPLTSEAFNFLQQSQSTKPETLFEKMITLRKTYHDTGKKYLEENIKSAQKEVVINSRDAKLNRVILDTKPGEFCQMDFKSELKHTSYSTFCNQSKSNYSFSETVIDPMYWVENHNYSQYSRLKVSYADFLRKILSDKNTTNLIKKSPESYSLNISLNALDTINPYWEASVYSWDDEAPYHTFKLPAKMPKSNVEVTY